MTISLIIPTYNERECIGEILSATLATLRDVEVIVVDDDSPDETWRVASELGDPRVRVMRRTSRRGLASAIFAGIEAAHGDVIGWFDADLPLVPRFLPDMIEHLSIHDLVILSRYVPGGGDRRSPVRTLASSTINTIARSVLGSSIRDYDSGIVICRKSVFERVHIRWSGMGEYFIELVYACRKKGLRILELPYVLQERPRGVSKTAPTIPALFLSGIHYVTRIVTARL